MIRISLEIEIETDDTSPNYAQIVGRSLYRDMQTALDISPYKGSISAYDANVIQESTGHGGVDDDDEC